MAAATERRDVGELLDEADATPVAGWDFSWLGERVATTPLPWDFEELVLRHARGAPDLLDMGTGGGERLAAMSYRPPRTVATEAWPPNVDVAGARLRPLGVTVVRVEGAPDNVGQRSGEAGGRLPFPGASFALVSNRHESFVATEVARVLGPNGTFVTQQVGANRDDFYDALELDRPPRGVREWDVRLAVEQVEAAGVRVTDSADAVEVTSFTDVGALAWYLKAIPWTVPSFSIAAHRDRLAALQRQIEAEGPICVTQRRFWLEARKRPAAVQPSLPKLRP